MKQKRLFDNEKLWKEHIEKLTKEAIDFLKENVKDEIVIVGFSGGKDSSVVYDLVKKAGIKHIAVFNFTTIEIPENVHFIKKYYPEVKWLKPKKSFYQYVQEKGMPSMFKRWCCEYLKEKPLFEFCRKYNIKIAIAGIRKEESPKRAKYGRKNFWKRILHLYPIYEWSSLEVWKYIEFNNLLVPNYYKIFPRNGCIPCPLMTSNRIKKMIELYPQYFKKLKEAYEIYRTKHKKALPFEEAFRLNYKCEIKNN